MTGQHQRKSLKNYCCDKNLNLPILIAYIAGSLFFIAIAALIFRWILGMKQIARSSELSAILLKKIAEKNGLTDEEKKEITKYLDSKY